MSPWIMPKQLHKFTSGLIYSQKLGSNDIDKWHWKWLLSVCNTLSTICSTCHMHPLKDNLPHNTYQIYNKPHLKNTQMTLEYQIFDETSTRISRSEFSGFSVVKTFSWRRAWRQPLKYCPRFVWIARADWTVSLLGQSTRQKRDNKRDGLVFDCNEQPPCILRTGCLLESWPKQVKRRALSSVPHL